MLPLSFVVRDEISDYWFLKKVFNRDETDLFTLLGCSLRNTPASFYRFIGACLITDASPTPRMN